jgi:hypothetical protein
MSNPSTVSPDLEANPQEANAEVQNRPSYVKRAMRNMVRKRGTSLKHFLLSTVGVLAVLVGLAYLTR